tara:strand:- start:3836 stop:5254 length:1419 start_codon:yes stop_codon:yes gene_type:complete
MNTPTDIEGSRTYDGPTVYNGLSLLADPIHQYISLTVPTTSDPEETTEKDLLDSLWLQRLRSIYQLQSTRWVFPSAEHSRFQHSIGAMHIAGRFARHLYPSLKQTFPNLPSPHYIEELLRIAALLHDIGHGPFCHFFDQNILAPFHITHEQIGQTIITDQLGDLIQTLSRSPHGSFLPGETIDPSYIAFLILKDPTQDNGNYPRWLTTLQPILGGVYTADNLDYVLRDAYMCGVAIGPVDLTRIIHYTFITPKGLTIHRAGIPALQMFLNARLYLYSNVYYHRTTRAIDIHLRDIFRETMQVIFPHHPLESLEKYLFLTDTALLETVRQWPISPDPKKQQLGTEWHRVLYRKTKWKTAYEVSLPSRNYQWDSQPFDSENFERKVRAFLPDILKNIEFRVDIANKDGRPINPLNMGNFQIYVYDPSTKVVSKEALKDSLDYIPSRIAHLRVFALNHDTDAELSHAAKTALDIV